MKIKTCRYVNLTAICDNPKTGAEEVRVVPVITDDRTLSISRIRELAVEGRILSDGRLAGLVGILVNEVHFRDEQLTRLREEKKNLEEKLEAQAEQAVSSDTTPPMRPYESNLEDELDDDGKVVNYYGA